MQQQISDKSHKFHREIIALASKAPLDGLEIKCTPIQRLSSTEKHDIFSLFKTTYPDWTHEHIFKQFISATNHYTYSLSINNKLIASRQIHIIENSQLSPSWPQELISSLLINQFAIGSRAIVHPDYRNSGIGTLLVKHINGDVFNNHNVDTILGSSTKLGAISLYMRLGAKIWLNDIYKLPYMNNAQEKIKIFEHLLRTNELKTIRLDRPIRYLYQKHDLPAYPGQLVWPNQNKMQPNDYS